MLDGHDTGFLTVLFKPDIARERQGPALKTVVEKHPGATFEPLITSVSLEQLLSLEKRATERRKAAEKQKAAKTKKAAEKKKSGKTAPAPRRSLTSYWRVDARALAGKLESLEESLRSLGGIERVTRDQELLLAVDPLDDPFSASQGYLFPASDGINAHWAWTQSGGDGQGLQFVDLEQAWRDNHLDLQPFSQIGPGRYGGRATLPVDHGSAVLGIVAARDNAIGIIGIAPEVKVRVVSTCVANDNLGAENAADALAVVLAAVPPADVLVIETTFSNYPLEIDPSGSMATAIRALVDAGTVVVEAAGNAGDDLAQFSALDPMDPNFVDSGAILVGSSVPQPGPHTRRLSSNFGTRVNCFAWGEGIVTAGYGDLSGSGKKSYTEKFGGTSGAAAIIAGAALLLIGIYETATGSQLSPEEVRDALVSAGTQQTFPPNGLIGVMPDLSRIVPALLNL